MDAKQLHYQAEELREKDQLVEALKLYEEAIVNYQKEKDCNGLTECLGGRCLTYKHLFLLNDDYVFFNLAKHSAISSLEIAKNYNLEQKIYRCLFRLGEMEMLVNNYSEAINYYQKSLELYPQEEAEKGDFQYHLGEAQYKSGDKINGKRNLLDGLALIEKYENSTDSFVFHVWQSGAYKTLAKLLWHDSSDEAKKYLEIGSSIAQKDDRLIIRRRQFEELKRSLNL